MLRKPQNEPCACKEASSVERGSHSLLYLYDHHQHIRLVLIPPLLKATDTTPSWLSPVVRLCCHRAATRSRTLQLAPQPAPHRHWTQSSPSGSPSQLWSWVLPPIAPSSLSGNRRSSSIAVSSSSHYNSAAPLWSVFHLDDMVTDSPQTPATRATELSNKFFFVCI